MGFDTDFSVFMADRDVQQQLRARLRYAATVSSLLTSVVYCTALQLSDGQFPTNIKPSAATSRRTMTR
jgi:hypothetical protein